MRASEEFGPYVVYEQIGLGGMATVHRAETQGIAGFSKQVALKRMLPNVAADASLVKSFIREARLASHLRHANVAQTYDLGKVGDTYFIAMELVPGRNLREILKHCAFVAGHMPLAIAMNIVNQIGDALDYAHNLCDDSGEPLGIIHRDVSPANVIVSEGGVVKLIDFGIAKASGGGMQTLSGTIKGKFSYLAPECLMGNVDARSDLFALGVIAYELLTNRPLFQGKDDMDTLYRVKDMPIIPPSRINPNVPHEIEAIILTALERDPEKRWQRATAMRQAMTTETQRLGLVAHNTQVEEWIDKAFRQQFQEESEPSIVISRHTVELAQGTVPDDFRHATNDEMQTIVKPNGSKPMQAQSYPRVSTDAPTLDGQDAVGETTLTDEQPVSEFAVSTVIEQPNQQLIAQSASDWNSPSVVKTVHDRPPAADWGTANGAQTREVKLVDRRSSSPHVINRGSGSNPALRLDGEDDQPSPRDSSPTLTQARSQRPSQPPTKRPSSPPPIESAAHRPSSPPPTRPSPAHLEPPAGKRPSSPPPTRPSPAQLEPPAGKRPSSPPPMMPSPPAMPRRPAPEFPDVTRPDTPVAKQSRQSGPAAVPPSGARTAPHAAQLAPNHVAMSGSRTAPVLMLDSDAAKTDINVSASAVLHEADVGAVLADLDQRSSVATPPKLTQRPGAGNYLLALLVLIAAGGAAAVVYFALPYLT